MKIVLDTSMILAIFERKRDILTEIEDRWGKNKIIIPSIVIEELEQKKKKGEVALKLIENKQIPIEKYCGKLQGDDAILEFCENLGAILATEDRELLKRAKNKHLKTLRIRSKTGLI